MSETRLNVLQVGKYYPPQKGGIETHLQLLCGALCKKVNLEVLVANNVNKAQEDEIEGVSVSRVPTIRVLASAPICPKLIRKVRDSDAEIVHLHLPNPMAVLAHLLSFKRKTLVITYHSDTVRQRLLGFLFAPLLHVILRLSDAIIVSSEQYRDSSKALTRHIDRCCVIPFGIRLESFEKCDLDSVAAIKKEFGNRLILSVGRLVYYKGFEHLIRAMQNVSGKLLIVGDGPLREDLKQLVSDLALMGKVVFLGSLPDELMIPYYHAADIFALASTTRAEAFGIVQVEAMAAGLPVVNTQLDSGVPFVSVGGVTGLTVPPGDSGALAGALNQLLDDDDLRHSYGVAARTRARQKFDLDTMAELTLATYQAATTSRRSPKSALHTSILKRMKG